MAANKKKKSNGSKSNSKKKTTVSAKKKNTKKTTSTAKKTTNTKKNNNKPKQVKETKEVKQPKEEKVVEQEVKEEVKLEVVEPVKEEVKVEKKNKKEEKKQKKEEKKLKKAEKKSKKEEKKSKKEKTSKKETKKVKEKKIKVKEKSNENILKRIIKKFKSFTLPVKVLIIVSFVCGIVLVIEGVLALNHKGYLDRHTVYYESYNGVEMDGDYIVVVGGSDLKHGSFTNSKDNERGKIVKYNEKGEVKFEKTYTRGISTTFTSVTSVSDGYIVTGTGIFSEEEQKSEGKEAVIIKYSKSGEIIWEKFYQVITDTSFNKVIAVSDGYVAIGQSIYANMEMGNHTTGGGIIVKYDFDGNEVWHNNHGGTKSGNFKDIVQVKGDYYVVGKDGADSANIVKFNNKGEYQWHKNYSFTDSVGFTGIAYAEDGLYVVGSKKILEDENQEDRTTSNTDALLVKYDMDGNVKFEKTFGGSNYERYNNIIAYHNNFYVVGHTTSKDAGLKITNDKADEMTGFVVRYDINGNILKKEVFGGSNNDNLLDIDTDGVSYYVVGYSNSGDGNIDSSKSNGKDYVGKLIKLNSKFKKLFVK